MSHDSGGDERLKGVEQQDLPVSYDWRSFESPMTAVVEAAAAATGRTVLELPPLQHTVDADSLNAMVEDSAGTEPTEVTFQYAELQITVDSAGKIHAGTQKPA